MRRTVLAATAVPNAVCTVTSALGLLPGAALYPRVANAALVAAGGSVTTDAVLCFGPLLVPGALLLGGAALHRSWSGAADATRWNLRALAAWGACAGLAGWVLA